MSPSPFSGGPGEVQFSRDIQRVTDLPRRAWAPEDAQLLAEQLTSVLKTPGGTMTLKPIQAVALFEASRLRGGYFPIRVGGGKTLVTALLGTTMGARRPVLLIPAELREKTEADFAELRIHWRLPRHIRIVHYEGLSNKAQKHVLEELLPDLIICDESHRVKNGSAACTKRLARYIGAHRDEVNVVLMTGTPVKRSIKDYAHHLSWALRSMSPGPTSFPVMQEWMRAIDINVNGDRRLGPGALSSFGPGHVRHEWRDRVAQTPGVVGTQEEPLPNLLTITSKVLDAPECVDKAFHDMRCRWETPDGYELTDGMQVWNYTRQFASGFFYIWDPRAPDAWLTARSGWASACRQILKNNRRQLDSESEVKDAVLEGHYPQATPLLMEWLRMEPTFTPNTVPVQMSDHVLDYASRWALAHPHGAVWVEHRAMGAALEARGLPLYSAKAVDQRTGQLIDHHRDGPAVCQRKPCSTGHNLQHHFRDNLIVTPPSNGSEWEQMLGRTHRDGQLADEVTVEVLFGSREDVKGFWAAVADSGFAEDLTGQAQKLTHADLEGVETLEHADARPGWAWQKNIT